MSYTPRGWLNDRKVSANGVVQTTAYEYDDVGQLKKVTMPDNSAVSYAYDNAHRLTTISDSLGNSIIYTLDSMGNRTRERVEDPQGTLVRNTARVFDALNNLKQQTGGTQ